MSQLYNDMDRDSSTPETEDFCHPLALIKLVREEGVKKFQEIAR